MVDEGWKVDTAFALVRLDDSANSLTPTFIKFLFELRLLDLC